jgi:hypothetical protein
MTRTIFSSTCRLAIASMLALGGLSGCESPDVGSIKAKDGTEAQIGQDKSGRFKEAAVKAPPVRARPGATTKDEGIETR